MIAVQDLRSGATFKLDGQPWIVIKYEHIKMGRGSATIRVKVKNLKTGATLEKSFMNSAKVEEINTQKKKMQYLYNDGKNYIFMDAGSYEQVEISKEILGPSAAFLKEGMDTIILFWDEKPLWVEMPLKMEFTITETPPGVKGNSATNMFKPATLENGYQIKVPLFINKGDKIRVDTRSGEYIERAS